MKPNRQRRRAVRHKYAAETLLLCIAVLLCVFIFLTDRREKRAESAEETVSFSATAAESLIDPAAETENQSGAAAAENTVLAPVISEEAEAEAKQREETANDGMRGDCPRIYLTQYTLVLNEGDTFDPMAYVAYLYDDRTSAGELLQKLQISGMDALSEPGEHEVIYVVFDGQRHSSHETVLTVRVEEQS